MKKKRSRGQRVLSLLLTAVMFCGLWSFSGASVSEVYGAESLKPEAPAPGRFSGAGHTENRGAGGIYRNLYGSAADGH